jgi:hypothetical protein
MWPRLYKGIKPLYLPLARAVDVDVGIVPGGWALPDDAPVVWRRGVRRVFGDSRWSTQGALYVHYGAISGLSGLKVVDDRQRERVLIVPVDPRKFMLVYESPFDVEPIMSIFVEMQGRGDARGEYAEVILPDEVQTYWRGEPRGFGAREEIYSNVLGFVPYVEIKHFETGDPLGESTYENVIPMLDEVNELASYLADVVKKHSEPQWAISGAEPSALEHSGDNVWFLPQGAEATPLVPEIDIEGVLAFVDRIQINVHDGLPELSFTELRKRERVATATLELQMLELTLKVQRMRSGYDEGLALALRMAGLAGVQMGLQDVAGLADPDVALDEGRRVLPLDEETRLRIESLALTVDAQRQAGLAVADNAERAG